MAYAKKCGFACGMHEPSNSVRLQGGKVAASPSDVRISRVDGVVVGVSGWTFNVRQATFERLANDYTLCR